VLVSSSEYGVYEVVQQVFQKPDPVEALEWFGTCCGLVVVWFVAGRLAGSVAAMFK
jgi:hypothetical protein